VEFTTDLPFDGCLDITNRLQDFLSLAVRDAVLPVELDGRSEQYKIKRGRKFHYEPIQILYRLIDTPIKKKKLVPYDLLFTLGDIQENIGEYLKNWLQKAELLRPIYSLYFGTLYNPHV
jgi:ApeA-like protein